MAQSSVMYPIVEVDQSEIDEWVEHVGLPENFKIRRQPCQKLYLEIHEGELDPRMSEHLWTGKKTDKKKGELVYIEGLTDAFVYNGERWRRRNFLAKKGDTDLGKITPFDFLAEDTAEVVLRFEARLEISDEGPGDVTYRHYPFINKAKKKIFSSKEARKKSGRFVGMD